MTIDTLLANTYSLYLKTQSHHWNVKGDNFYQLHSFFQSLYENLALKIDEIAELIRMNGVLVEASFQKFASISKISDPKSNITQSEMIKDLHKSYEILNEMIQEFLLENSDRNIAQLMKEFSLQNSTQSQVRFFEQFFDENKKTIWMLNSMI